MKECALTTALTRGITTFKASNGSMEKFMKRAGIDSSVRLHGRGGPTIPNGHEDGMNQIRDVCFLYPLRNTYNMDESGLFYRLCPRMSCLPSSKIRRDVRGTDLQRNKNRITIVTAYGSHILPVWYIGHASNSKCFRDSRHTALKSFYSNQTNAWMGSKEYNTWLQWWFVEVRKVTQNDILLIMHNRGSHEEGINLHGLRVEFLPPKSTYKYQPLDFGIIALAKIRYRTILLPAIINNTPRWNSGEHNFPLTSQNGRWQVADDHLPHIADAMITFSKAWSKLMLSTVLKCWSKSQYLSMLQVGQAREQTGQSNTGSEESSVTPVLSQEVSEEIYSDIFALNCQTQVENPLSEIMPPCTSISNATELFEALNSFSVTGEEISRHDTAAKKLQKMLQKMFDNSRLSEVDNNPSNANDIENEQDLLFLFQISAETLSIFYETSPT